MNRVEVLKIVDTLFHRYASSYRIDAKEDAITLIDKVEPEQLIIADVICSSRGGVIKFVKGQKVCSYGDKTTFGYIDSWDEAENCWRLTTDIEGDYRWFAVDEPSFFDNYI